MKRGEQHYSKPKTKVLDLRSSKNDSQKVIHIVQSIFCTNCQLNILSQTGNPAAKTVNRAEFIYDGQGLCANCVVQWMNKKRQDRIAKQQREQRIQQQQTHNRLLDFGQGYIGDINNNY